MAKHVMHSRFLISSRKMLFEVNFDPVINYFFRFHQKPIRQDSTNRVSVITIILSANGLTTLGNSG